MRGKMRGKLRKKVETALLWKSRKWRTTYTLKLNKWRFSYLYTLLNTHLWIFLLIWLCAKVHVLVPLSNISWEIHILPIFQPMALCKMKLKKGFLRGHCQWHGFGRTKIPLTFLFRLKMKLRSGLDFFILKSFVSICAPSELLLPNAKKSAQNGWIGS